MKVHEAIFNRRPKMRRCARLHHSLYDPLSHTFIQDSFRRGGMETQLVGIRNTHPLIPEGRDRTVDQVVIRSLRSWASVVGGASPTVVNQTPEIVSMEIASHERQTLKSRQIVPRDP
jgi:hypothetical protein